jgi:hypothetical protein
MPHEPYQPDTKRLPVPTQRMKQAQEQQTNGGMSELSEEETR